MGSGYLALPSWYRGCYSGAGEGKVKKFQFRDIGPVKHLCIVTGGYTFDVIKTYGEKWEGKCPVCCKKKAAGKCGENAGR